MKYILVLALAVLPTCVSASSVFGSLPNLPEDVRVQGAAVYTSSSASASSGGQTVSGGQVVSTEDSEVSVSITNTVQTSSSGGSVQMQVTTSKNGVVTEERYEKTLAPNESVKATIGTSSPTVSAESSLQVRASEKKDTSTGHILVKDIEIQRIEAPAHESAPTLFMSFSHFFTNIFRLFTFWK